MYTLLVPIYYLLEKHPKGYKNLAWASLEDRYIEKDGKLIFKPYYIIALNYNYELEIIHNKDGSVDHLLFNGDLDSCNDIINYYGIIDPNLKAVEA